MVRFRYSVLVTLLQLSFASLEASEETSGQRRALQRGSNGLMRAVTTHAKTKHPEFVLAGEASLSTVSANNTMVTMEEKALDIAKEEVKAISGMAGGAEANIKARLYPPVLPHGGTVPVTQMVGGNVSEIHGFLDFVVKDAPDMMLSTAVLDVVKQEISGVVKVAADDIEVRFESPAAPQSKERLGLVAINYQFGVPANSSSDAVTMQIAKASWADLASDIRIKFASNGLNGTGLAITRFNSVVKVLRVLGPLAPTLQPDPALSGPDRIERGVKSGAVSILLLAFVALVSACIWQWPRHMHKMPGPVGNGSGLSEGVLRTPAATFSSVF